VDEHQVAFVAELREERSADWLVGAAALQPLERRDCLCGDALVFGDGEFVPRLPVKAEPSSVSGTGGKLAKETSSDSNLASIIPFILAK
jgi:hypothetical protein